MKVTIDSKSGFCFGVVYAIEMAENILVNDKKLYCLGYIVHNNREVDRLNNLGLEIIDHKRLKSLKKVDIVNSMINGKNTYKVIIGPFENLAQLNEILKIDTIQQYEDLSIFLK